jgi:coatomer subunit gamma
MFDLLEQWLRHKSDMVNFEAARAICEMKSITSAQLTKSIAGKSLYQLLQDTRLINIH